MNNQLPNQLLNSTLLPITPINKPINNLNQPLPQFVPMNQSPSSTQNISKNGIPIPKNEKDISKLLKYNNYFLNYFFSIERQRRSKHELVGRDFTCECGKSYLSQPALNNHIKKKHPEKLEGEPQRSRGRPRKYPKKEKENFELTKYDTFFNQNGRSPEDGNSFDVLPVVKEVFNFIYESPNANKLFSKPKSFNDIPVLFNLVSGKIIPTKPNNEKTCDEGFSEYLISFINQTNRKYFSFMLKFVLLFRECYDLSKNNGKKEDEKKAVTNLLSSEELPDLCNEFYGHFMEMNGFFGIDKDEEKKEIVEIIQHFCLWLFKNGYTKSKLSLA